MVSCLLIFLIPWVERVDGFVYIKNTPVLENLS